MKKVALVFLLAVFVPSLVLAWLAIRSLRDQQFVIERQRSLLCQGIADSLAKEAENFLAERQRDFRAEVDALLAKQNPADAARTFDERLRADWPLAQVGFVVTLNGQLLCPSPSSSPQAQMFCSDNGKFLGNQEVAQVYWNPKTGNKGFAANDSNTSQKPASNPNALPQFDTNSPIKGQQLRTVSQQQTNTLPNQQQSEQQPQIIATPRAVTLDNETAELSVSRAVPIFKNAQGRNALQPQTFTSKGQTEEAQQLSKVTPSEAEFRQLIGDGTEGALARFLENKLNVLVWYRSPRNPQLVFGAQLALNKMTEGLRNLLREFHPESGEGICLAILDDKARPVAASVPQYQTNWKRPFAATEIGEALPHWEAAVYLLDPKALTKSAETLKLTLGLLIAVLVVAISVGGWLILTDLSRQLKLARQKTDFVSNVSHELKTPLTSIRMFSELLAEGRVSDPAKQRSYLNIITAETARLTRLINNVLDFSRLERGEKKYNFRDCDLVSVARDTAETYRPHLENNGFKFDCSLPAHPLPVRGDTDALAQVIVNLLSNAEKYSDSRKEIVLETSERRSPTRHVDVGVQASACPPDRLKPELQQAGSETGAPNAGFVEVRVLDRGLGVPAGSEEKIFEQFYRAHDSLSSGIQGSGLGLTLARQIARAHGGDVVYEPREGGGSCFALRLPLKQIEITDECR